MTDVMNAAAAAQANQMEQVRRCISSYLHTPFNFNAFIQYLQSHSTTNFSENVANAVAFAQAPTSDVAQATVVNNFVHTTNNHVSTQVLPVNLQIAFNQAVADRRAVGSSITNDGRPGSSTDGRPGSSTDGRPGSSNDGNNNPGNSPGGSSASSGASASTGR